MYKQCTFTYVSRETHMQAMRLYLWCRESGCICNAPLVAVVSEAAQRTAVRAMLLYLQRRETAQAIMLLPAMPSERNAAPPNERYGPLKRTALAIYVLSTSASALQVPFVE